MLDGVRTEPPDDATRHPPHLLSSAALVGRSPPLSRRGWARSLAQQSLMRGRAQRDAHKRADSGAVLVYYPGARHLTTATPPWRLTTHRRDIWQRGTPHASAGP